MDDDTQVKDTKTEDEPGNDDTKPEDKPEEDDTNLKPEVDDTKPEDEPEDEPEVDDTKPEVDDTKPEDEPEVDDTKPERSSDALTPSVRVLLRNFGVLRQAAGQLGDLGLLLLHDCQNHADVLLGALVFDRTGDLAHASRERVCREPFCGIEFWSRHELNMQIFFGGRHAAAGAVDFPAC